MILRKYQIELRSLRENDLDEVLDWRNDAFVRNQMIFQNTISQEEHREWFATLNQHSLYLIIVYRGKKIGVINLKEIDWNTRSAEAGIFIGKANYRNTFIPMLAILCLMDVCFAQFEFKKMYAKVRKDNTSALTFNKDLGYSELEKFDDFIKLQVTAEHYWKERQKFTAFLEKYEAEGESEIILTAEEQGLYLPRLK